MFEVCMLLGILIASVSPLLPGEEPRRKKRPDHPAPASRKGKEFRRRGPTGFHSAKNRELPAERARTAARGTARA